MSDDLSGLEVLGSGRIATVYRLDGEHVLKVFHRPGEAAHEYRQVSQVWQTGVSCQQPLECLEVGGQEAIVYSYVQGEDLGHWLEQSPLRLPRCMALLADCHAPILRSVSDELPALRNSLHHRIENAPYLNEFERGCLLAGLLSMPEGDAVLHGDLHPYNIVMLEGQPRAIDWVSANRGEPEADIARTFFLLRYAAQQDDRNCWDTMKRVAIHWLAARLYLRRIKRLTTVRWAGVRAWLPFVAAARLQEDPTNTEVQSILRLIVRFCRQVSQ